MQRPETSDQEPDETTTKLNVTLKIWKQLRHNKISTDLLQQLTPELLHDTLHNARSLGQIKVLKILTGTDMPLNLPPIFKTFFFYS